jgi:predicted membrane-bound spermidine synthase
MSTVTSSNKETTNSATDYLIAASFCWLFLALPALGLVRG